MTTDAPQKTSPDRPGRNGSRPGSVVTSDPDSRHVPGRGVPRVPRRYGQWAGAVLLVLVSVLLAGWLWQQKSDRVEVLAVSRQVPAGSVIGSGDLAVVEVAGVGGAVPSARVGEVLGRTTVVGLVPGQLLDAAVLTSDPVPAAGERVVGVQVDGTRAPGGLAAGDRVSVVAVPPTGDASSPSELDDPTTLAASAVVRSVDVVEGAGSRIALVVPDEVADTVASFGAAGRVALVQAPLGGDD
ncbi:SAF domain-containing protein [Nocardioides aurantiacus]|uniref:SAF domain-containing protein n=1 Tax=Nocardioides aurantiacus TaxID=86796 RepID=UPI0011CE497F|nr:SAF domain-containing protein [Nocardioides aurantiacus]